MKKTITRIRLWMTATGAALMTLSDAYEIINAVAPPQDSLNIREESWWFATPDGVRGAQARTFQIGIVTPSLHCEHFSASSLAQAVSQTVDYYQERKMLRYQDAANAEVKAQEDRVTAMEAEDEAILPLVDNDILF